MGKLNNYTEEEWALLSATPQLVGLAMAGVGSSGIIGSSKEMFANARGLIKAKKEYASNSLIQAILPDTSSTSKAMEDAKAQREVVMDRIKENDIKSSDQLVDLILKDSAAAISLLEEKDPEKVADYKKWLLEVAENIANAAKEGDFLGFGGERFSEKEQHLFKKLKTNLS